MARLTIYRDNYVDSTVVSNYFIDHYMKDANDAQLKVYLYLIRMLNANRAISVSDIADKFNHTEKDVMRALKYWEKKQLLSLEYDGEGSLTGIHLRDLKENHDAPDADLPSELSSAGAALEAEVPAEASPFRKPVYTTSQLAEFKSRKETTELLAIAQAYISRPLTPAEMKSILFFMDELHFSENLIDYLLDYCVSRGKKDFKYIDKVAISWAEQGITAPEQAKAIVGRYDKTVYAIMDQLGKSGSPTAKELEFINRWLKEYGFGMDIIFEACERTVLATDKHRFEYADSILSSWLKENVHRKSDILRIDELYQQKRRNTVRNAGTGNKFNQFKQNDYNFDELERELLSN